VIWLTSHPTSIGVTTAIVRTKLMLSTYSEVVVRYIQSFDTASALQQLWVHDAWENSLESLLFIVDWDDFVGLVVIITHHHSNPDASGSTDSV